MLPPLILNFKGNADLARLLTQRVVGELGALIHRQHPDGETYIRIEDIVKDRDVIIVTDLSHPDSKIIPLIFTARTATTLGAARVGLVAPYLPYMRQDKAFLPGEAISARYFADLLSDGFDWMVTVDPHLHRISDLAHVYMLEPVTLKASCVIVDWVRQHVRDPVIIGPDSESKQWVEAVAQSLDCPYIVASKSRFGDHRVKIDLPDISAFKSRTPVIIDDIISSGTTLLEVVKALRLQGLTTPMCLAVHALFDDEIKVAILQAGAGQIVTTDTIIHSSNGMSVTPLIADAVSDFIG